ncbi:MAG: hypothetical protein NTV49_04420 [Kiritimatiellaeota bacterium]|nr:hypothetical protein [Kiritimatiellota bacterium]
MKQLLVIVVLACAVTRTWAGLGHVKTIDAEPMAAEATVEEAVSVKPAQLAHCLLVTGALPVVAPIARSRWNAVALPAVVPMRGDLALTGKGLPRITAARFTSMQK